MMAPQRFSATVGLIVLLGACGHVGPRGLGVQALPPDHIPPDLYHDSVMVTDGATRSSRAVIAVEFNPEATVSARREAIESVDGRVVGGVRIGIEGYYLVWVPHEDSLEAVDTAIRVLRRSHHVWTAIRVDGLKTWAPPQRYTSQAGSPLANPFAVLVRGHDVRRQPWLGR